MAEYLSTENVRNYPLSNGETADLIALIGTSDPARLVRSNGSLTVGTVAYVYAMNNLRRGVVTKVTKTKTFVSFTTQGAVTEDQNANGWGRGVRVQTTGDPHTWILVDQGDVYALALAEDAEREEARREAAEVEAYEDDLAFPEQYGEPQELTVNGTEDDGCGCDDGDCGADPEIDNHGDALGSPELEDEEDLTLHSQDGKVSLMTNESTTKTETAPAQDHTGSAVVRLLEKVWSRIREDHPELPEVVIVTGSGLIGGSKWGHFRANGWKVREEGAEVSLKMHEMFMAGETLAKGAHQVLQTMLHEGAHTLAKVREVQDTSRQGRWHNGNFRKLAEEMGLEHRSSQADKSAGYSFVTLTEATKARYADLLAELSAEIRLMCDLPGWLGGTTEQGEDKGGEKITGKPGGAGQTETQSGNLKATCDCEEPNIIRLSRKVLDLGVVKCVDCDELFTAA